MSGDRYLRPALIELSQGMIRNGLQAVSIGNRKDESICTRIRAVLDLKAANQDKIGPVAV